MGIKSLSLLHAGCCKVDASILDTTVSPGGQSTNLPIWVYLIDTTDGPILIDTGMPDSCVSEPLGLFKGMENESSIIPLMREEDKVLKILERKGYHPNDLACIISSHLHFDHAGGNALFPKTEIVIQSLELDAAMNDSSYFDICKKPDLKYRVISGDKELIPGIHLISTPGHSLGHQSIMIRTKESGNILLTIDAAYTEDNFEKNVPFAVHSQEEAHSSISKLKEITISEKAKVFFGHDTEQEKEWSDQLVIY